MSTNIQPDAKNKYFDPHRDVWAIKLKPGEFHVSRVGDEELLVTTLGSCVSACIRDRKLGVGGMNHFMLPLSDDGNWAGASSSTRYGNYAMEHMINEIYKQGGVKENLEVSIFGGAVMFGDGSTTRVGQSNIKFVREYLQTEGFRVHQEDLGGGMARKVYFDPRTGEISVTHFSMEDDSTVTRREKELKTTITNQPVAGDVELF